VDMAEGVPGKDAALIKRLHDRGVAQVDFCSQGLAGREREDVVIWQVWPCLGPAVVVGAE
jgi:hypothetical protein